LVNQFSHQADLLFHLSAGDRVSSE